MSVLNRDEYINRLHTYVGEDSSDDAISFLEDMIDTFEDMENRTGDAGEWERRYNELDETWRKRYKHRFITGYSNIDQPEDPDETDLKPEEVEVDDLFEEVE